MGLIINNGGSRSGVSLIETKIANGVDNVVFSNLGTFSLWQIIGDCRAAAGASNWVSIQFNGDDAANYNFESITGFNAVIAAATNSALTYLTPGRVNDTYRSLFSCKVSQYGAGFTKTIQSGASGSQTDMALISGFWNNTTDALTSIKIFNPVGNFVNSRFSLYGIQV